VNILKGDEIVVKIPEGMHVSPASPTRLLRPLSIREEGQSHLKSIFEKSGVIRQGEMIALYPKLKS
jgi:hypothetical protein